MNTTFNSYQAVLEHKDIPAGHVLVEDIQKNIKFEQPPTARPLHPFCGSCWQLARVFCPFSNDTVLQAKQAKSGYDRKLQTLTALRCAQPMVCVSTSSRPKAKTLAWSPSSFPQNLDQPQSAASQRQLRQVGKTRKMQARNKLTRHGFLALSANEALLLPTMQSGPARRGLWQSIHTW